MVKVIKCHIWSSRYLLELHETKSGRIAHEILVGETESSVCSLNLLTEEW